MGAANESAAVLADGAAPPVRLKPRVEIGPGRAMTLVESVVELRDAYDAGALSPEEAVAEFSRFLKLGNTVHVTCVALNYRALALVKLGRLVHARCDLTLLLSTLRAVEPRHVPSEDTVALRLARVCWHTNTFVDAVALVQCIVERVDPVSVHIAVAIEELADMLILSHRFAEAEVLCARRLTMGWTPLGAYRRATALRGAARYAEALVEYDRALAVEPRDDWAGERHSTAGMCTLAGELDDMFFGLKDENLSVKSDDSHDSDYDPDDGGDDNDDDGE